MTRVPQSPTDFPQYQLAEPLYAGIVRVLKRDLALACLMSIVPDAEASQLAAKYLDAKSLYVAVANPVKEVFPHVIVRYTGATFPKANSGGTGKRIEPNHVFEFRCAVYHERETEATSLILRLVRGVFAVIHGAEVADLWAMESTQAGISLTKTIQAIAVEPEAELTGQNKFVRRAVVTFNFEAQELDARQVLQPEQINAMVFCKD